MSVYTVILHVLYAGARKTLRGCLDLLTDPARPIEAVLEEMMVYEHDPSGERGWREAGGGCPTTTHPLVAGSARALLNKSENERSSVISSTVKCLSLYRDDLVAEKTSRSDFKVMNLVDHEKPVSLYLVVPPSDVSRTRPLMRLLIHQVGSRLTESLDGTERAGEGAARHRLLLMMDEFPTLGRLDFFETQLAYLAGYGIQAFLIVQDLSQLYAAYGHHESIVSNCHVRVAFAPNKIETARLLSEMAGVMTVRKPRRMYSGNRLAPWLSHVMASEEETHRALLTPDEALRIPAENALIFVAGERPIWAKKARFFADPRLMERTRIKPPENRPIEREAFEWLGTPAASIPTLEEIADRGDSGELDELLEDDEAESANSAGEPSLPGSPPPRPDRSVPIKSLV
ncbi:MAG: type IV secretory system conjugative DNA transfer family protein [bacterium]|nr:type IV secretory system conjugative DNA transfer family protein [bacterium]